MSELVNLKTVTKNPEMIKVSNLKIKYIENILNSAKLCDKIDAIILFGSSLEERCSEKSDIDIALVSKYPLYRLERLKSFSNFMNSIFGDGYTQDYDILYFKSLEEIENGAKEIPTIYSEIYMKGKIIYKKEEF